jgi:hypothetical protein
VTKERVHTLSTRYYKIYKIVLVAAMALLVLSYLVQGLMASQGKDLWQKLFSFGIGIIVPVYLTLYWYPQLIKMLRGFRKVSYDKYSLYVQMQDYEIQVPFERIKSVELTSLDGLYRFELYDQDQFGKYIYCKPSMWYPLNFPKIDKELDRIRWMIRKRKEQYYQQGDSNQLNSINT